MYDMGGRQYKGRGWGDTQKEARCVWGGGGGKRMGRRRPCDIMGVGGEGAGDPQAFGKALFQTFLYSSLMCFILCLPCGSWHKMPLNYSSAT